MTVTVNLPQKVEQSYLAAAETKGVSIEALVADFLVSNARVGESPRRPELIEEQGIPVLRTGQLPRYVAPGSGLPGGPSPSRNQHCLVFDLRTTDREVRGRP
jgi:hypothetical protein